ncbi:MAG: hypothetical protein AAGF87_11155 [Bacteroidota bacterium]
MFDFNLHPSLEELADQQSEQLQIRQQIQNQIREDYQDLLQEHQLNVQLTEQAPTLDPSVFGNIQFNTSPLVKDITDLNTFTLPYLQSAKKRIVFLYQVNNASLRENTTDSWQPAGYSHNNLSDANRGKMTATAHTDGFQSAGPTTYSTTKLEFLIGPLTQDYDEIAVVFQYIYGYAAAYELANNNQNKFVSQEIRLSISAFQIDTAGNQTYLADLPYNEILDKYERRFNSPIGNRPSTQTTIKKPASKLQYFAIPNAKQNLSYRIVFSLYSYGWPNNARLSTEGNFDLVKVV